MTLSDESPDEQPPDVWLKNRYRAFPSGATRDTDAGKLDYEGFLSPLVLKCFAEYMHRHRVQADGSLRASDNWQKGIPLDEYMKSAWRHFADVWGEHRRSCSRVDVLLEALCGLFFNVQGYMHEVLKQATHEDAVAALRRKVE